MLTATELTSEAKLALARLFSEKKGKEIRAEVGAGRYEIDEVVRVKATLKVGEDYEQEIPLKARPFLLASIFAGKVNEDTLKAVMADYRKALADALEAGDFAALDAKEDEVKPRVERAMDGLKAKTRTLCNGKVSCEVEIQEGLDGMAD